jgi:hypothetical protein
MKANGISVRDYVLQQAAPDLTLTKAVRYDIPSQQRAAAESLVGSI